MKYIDAEKLKAEIERRKRFYERTQERLHQDDPEFSTSYAIASALKELRSFIISLQQKQPETPSGEEVMNMCNQILIDWVKEGKTPEEREQREQAHIRFFELYDEYMQEQQEGDLEKEIEQWFDLSGISEAWENGEWSTNDIRSTARHFYELGLKAIKEE